MSDVQPDYSSPNSATEDSSWDLPNNNAVGWSVVHPEYDVRDVIAVTFWVVNTENNMQFYTTRVFVPTSDNA